ncbi:unnamed protein product [Thelazia callipaeda]|uniref:Uncharacterized protein n=1 Tax=Thelazia callipaeda TaxID=103827 RepID=A0A0N5CS78_THECL|nr:unnamed protein product [Thelazia callipaeda]
MADEASNEGKLRLPFQVVTVIGGRKERRSTGIWDLRETSSQS